MNLKSYATLLAGLLAALSTAAHAGFTVTTFSSAQWGADDGVIGVTGDTIEDFEDTTLIPGLQIGWSADAGTITPAGTLPTTFDPRPSGLGGNDPFGNAFYSHPCGSSACSSLWDGSKVLVSGFGNQSHPYSDASNWGNIDMVFTAPARSVGFSLQQNELGVSFRVNGGAAVLSVGSAASGGRFGYVRIDATDSDVIHSITFDNLAGDGWTLDHLAVAAVPEPETYALMLAGIGLVGWGARRARR